MNFIVPFNGDIANIPARWMLCDGNNGTPDLRDRFVKAINDFSEMHNIGGNATHSHGSTGSGGSAHTHGGTGSGGSHTHAIEGYNSSYQVNVYNGTYAGSIAYNSHAHSSSGTSSGSSHTHTTYSASNNPKYYKLIYLMSNKINFDFPVGSIVMFNGLATEIPYGWLFCDGTNGTPDLKNKFIRGAYKFSNIGDKKETSTSHTHVLSNTGSHTHSATSKSFSHKHMVEISEPSVMNIDNRRRYVAYGGNSHSHTIPSGGSHSHTISEILDNEPKYYKLAYIKRIA